MKREVELEQFFTKPEIAKKCIEQIDLFKFDKVIELTLQAQVLSQSKYLIVKLLIYFLWTQVLSSKTFLFGVQTVKKKFCL